MMSPDLRVLGAADGLPPLPDTEYLLCSDPATQNELAQVIFKSMQTYQNPWQYNQFTPEGGDDSLIVEVTLSKASQKNVLKCKCKKEPLMMKKHPAALFLCKYYCFLFIHILKLNKISR